MSSRHSGKKDAPTRPKTSHDFRRSSSRNSSRDSAQPPRRSETPAVGSSSSSHRRNEEKGYAGRKKRKERSHQLFSVGEEEEEEDGGASLNHGQSSGVPLSAQDAGYMPPQGYGEPPPDIDVHSPNDYTEEESRNYWTWDAAQNNFFHVDEQTGQIIWAARQFA